MYIVQCTRSETGKEIGSLYIDEKDRFDREQEVAATMFLIS